MLNDREERYDSPEESEYHFSDEEINYEVETESPKPVASEPREGIASRLTRSKRVLLSAGVFIVLVYVVYKMVAPVNSPAPSTTITPDMVAQQKTVTSPATSPAETIKPTQPVLSQTQGNVISVPGTTPPAMPSQPVAQQPAQPLPPPTTAAAQPAPVQAPAAPAVNNPPPNANVETLVTENQRLIGQLQADYAQKLNDYAAQSKALQDQIQALNTRMAGMESEINQLMQVLSRVGQTSQSNQANNQANNNVATNTPAPPQAVPAAPQPEVKIPYTVQAIIPGRAWLRSDNSETVTVAEGDVIKDIGRVTKVDPYDGVVEINTGNKVVSLSYGNGV